MVHDYADAQALYEATVACSTVTHIYPSAIAGALISVFSIAYCLTHTALDRDVYLDTVAAVAERLGPAMVRRLRDLPRLLSAPDDLALADPEEGVRHTIVDTLKGFGNRQAIAGLCAALRDPDRPVRQRAEHALHEFLGLRLVWPLFRCVLREHDPAVRQRVRAAATRVLLGMESR